MSYINRLLYTYSSGSLSHMYGKPTMSPWVQFGNHLSNIKISDIISTLFMIAFKGRIVLVSLKAFECCLSVELGLLCFYKSRASCFKTDKFCVVSGKRVKE